MTTRLVKCPTCEKSSRFDSANPYRPFCSERCKLIDLGAWASEDYKVPSEDDQPLSGDLPDTP